MPGPHGLSSAFKEEHALGADCLDTGVQRLREASVGTREHWACCAEARPFLLEPPVEGEKRSGILEQAAVRIRPRGRRTTTARGTAVRGSLAPVGPRRSLAEALLLGDCSGDEVAGHEHVVVSRVDCEAALM